MKSLLLVILIFLSNVSGVYAQLSTTELASKSANQRWGWFKPESWAHDLMLQEPGWRVQDRGKNSAGWDYVLFSTNDLSKAVSFQMQNGLIGTISFLFGENSPVGKNWITESFEQISANEWLDRSNNARIKRRYNGVITAYSVSYEPFVQE